MRTSTSPANRAILELTIDDSYALSEVVARLRSLQPRLAPNEARELARSSVLELVERGFVTITRLHEPGAEESEMSAQDARLALQDDLCWLEIPHWRPHLRVVATAEGAEAYRGGP